MSSISPIPGLVAATSLFFLANSGCISTIITVFLEQLSVPEQISLLSLLFALVYFAVDIALFIGPSSVTGEANHGDHSPPFQYPISEMATCKDDREKFTLIYPVLRDDIITQLELLSKGELSHSHEAMKWLVDCMDYNVPGTATRNFFVFLSLFLNSSLRKTDVAFSSLFPRGKAYSWAHSS
jgi:hypothetical protein